MAACAGLVRLLSSALHRRSAAKWISGRISRPGVRPTNKGPHPKKSNASSESWCDSMDLGCLGQPCPPCLIGYHTPNCSCSWTQHSTPVEEMERKNFLIQERRKPSFCLGNSKNKTAWMEKKVNGKIRSLSGVLERLRVLTEHPIH